jgi:nitroreductase
MSYKNTEKVARPDHDILPVLADRYSPYAFDGRPVEREKLLMCLEAARWAASSFNEQPWRYILAERTDEAAFNTALSCLVEANQAWAKYAGVLILTVTRRTFTKNDKPNRVCEHDIGLAAGNLTVQATALGLAVHQMAGVELQKVRLTYKVPDGFDPMTAIAIGYAADPDRFPKPPVRLGLRRKIRLPRRRRQMIKFIHHEGTETLRSRQDDRISKIDGNTPSLPCFILFILSKTLPSVSPCLRGELPRVALRRIIRIISVP